MGNFLGNLKYFVELTFTREVLWTVFPLAIATVVMLFYFEKYKEEKPDWNTFVANSLVLLFVSIIMFRYIYSINGVGAVNFVLLPYRSVVSLFVLFMGISLLLFNFEHNLPEKIARYVSSPLTVNLIAYVSILFVYSNVQFSWSVFLSLFFLFLFLVIVLNLVRIPINRGFAYLRKLKERERFEEIVEEKKRIQKIKSDVKKEEKKFKSSKLKELEKQKKQAVMLKKVLKKK